MPPQRVELLRRFGLKTGIGFGLRLPLSFAVLFWATMTLISVLCKRVMLRFVTTSMSKNGCGKWHFLVWNRVRIWRTGRHTPTKNTQEYPPGRVTYRIGVILNGYLFSSARKPIRHSVNIALNAGLVHKIELDLRHYCFFFQILQTWNLGKNLYFNLSKNIFFSFLQHRNDKLFMVKTKLVWQNK